MLAAHNKFLSPIYLMDSKKNGGRHAAITRPETSGISPTHTAITLLEKLWKKHDIPEVSAFETLSFLPPKTVRTHFNLWLIYSI